MTRSLSIPAAALLVLVASAAAQEDAPRKAPKAPAWPTLASPQTERVKQLFKNLAGNKEQLHESSEAELVALGAGAVPLILGRLSDHATNINPVLVRTLDVVTTAEHAPLLARDAKSRKLAVRRFVLRRLAEFHRAESAPVFRTALKDRDPEVKFAAQLGLAGLGEFEHMPAVFDRCTEHWSDMAALAGRALAGARGEAGTQWLLTRMSEGGTRDQVTGLRLLRTLGDRSAVAKISPYLDSETHNVKKAAINALRVIVDGEPPLEKLSVFEAIELANKWKERS